MNKKISGKKKFLRLFVFLIIVVNVCFQYGCNVSSKTQNSHETNHEEFERICSYLNEPKKKLMQILELSEEDLKVQIPLLYRVEKEFYFDDKKYYPWLEFTDETPNAQLLRYGFSFTNLSEEETLLTAQELVQTISTALELKNVPATNTFMNPNQTTESNIKGISGTTYEELEKCDSYQLTEVWNHEDSMYFQMDMSKISLQSGSDVILIRIAYVPEGYPAFSGV